MPKINQEEYEVLKGLDDRWKWIARDDENQIYSAEVHVFEKKPEREDGYWNNINCGEYELLREWDYLFQFIQWEDQEPYNISELIEEYEIKELRLAPSKTVIVDSFNESEETEVKKDKQWLIDRIENYIALNDKTVGDVVDGILELVNQLDEPEVLSPDWIKDNQLMWTSIHGTEYYVPANKLYGKIVPEQELPVIPKFVAEWYESEGKRSSWWNWFYKWGRDEGRTELETKTIRWMQDYNEEAFVNMFLHGYEVAEEQKYRVIFPSVDKNGEGFNYLAKDCYHKELWVEDARADGLAWEERSSFTEDEIRDLDKGDILFEHFAVPVEELEE